MRATITPFVVILPGVGAALALPGARIGLVDAAGTPVPIGADPSDR